MATRSVSETSDFWRSSMKDMLSSERLDEGARPVYSKQLVLASDNIQNFIPEYIREKFQERIKPNLCTIRAVCKAQQKEPFYTFVLSWHKIPAQADTEKSAPTSKYAELPTCVAPGSELKRQRSVQSLETTVEIASSTGEQTRRCDGPCGKMRPVKELRVHGQCEHAICLPCTINAPMIENADGSVGCCNEECFTIDLAAVCPDPVLRHKYFQKIINKHKMGKTIARSHGNGGGLQQAPWSSSISQISSVKKSSRAKRGGLKELMCVKVLVLEKGPMETVCRRHSVAELGSTEPLRSALQWIVGHGQSLHKSRIFFKYDGNFEDLKLQEIDLKEYGDKKISSFPSTDGMLNFVVDYTNVIRGNSFSPYI
ncbi:unnamed protein product [Litomosoides sigmodontis]|uniref:Uncharacterized protein n=1 Tax=Litomosoides sigmodontis TaxID=42156 RepID=A0A3P6S6D8_LITSI|nr:unnamed protein product [Litomosoides sigmodontis]